MSITDDDVRQLALRVQENLRAAVARDDGARAEQPPLDDRAAYLTAQAVARRRLEDDLAGAFGPERAASASQSSPTVLPAGEAVIMAMHADGSLAQVLTSSGAPVTAGMLVPLLAQGGSARDRANVRIEAWLARALDLSEWRGDDAHVREAIAAKIREFDEEFGAGAHARATGFAEWLQSAATIGGAARVERLGDRWIAQYDDDHVWHWEYLDTRELLDTPPSASELREAAVAEPQSAKAKPIRPTALRRSRE